MQHPIQLHMPNGEIIKSSHKALLPMTQLPLKAREAIIFPKLRKSLLSVSTLCNNGCTTTFDMNGVKVIDKENKVLLKGKQKNNLYLVDMKNDDIMTEIKPDTSLANHVYENKSNIDLVMHYHQACWSPAKATWIAAIKKNYFATWPGLTAELVQKYLPKSEHTVKGHLKQDFKNKNSTKQDEVQKSMDNITQFTSQDNKTRTHDVFLTVTDLQGKICTDQTGRFPVTSSRGNKYIMIAYDYDSNTINAEALKPRTGESLKNAYMKIQALLTSRGLKPKLHFLDNECAASFKVFMKSVDEAFQLVPPHLHRRNAAERSIQTWKNHFIAGLTSVHPDFPLHLWCRMLKQADTTLNLLRASRINPKLSAYAQLHGAFDYNATPLVPPGTKIIVHEKPAIRGSWAPRGLNGWYIGAAMEHYRCHEVFINKTAHTRIGDTVEFFPHHCRMPYKSSTENATAAARELIHALKNPAPAAPFANIGDKQMEALHKLSEIFAQTTTLTTNKTIKAPTHAMEPVKKLSNEPENSTRHIKTHPHAPVPRVTPSEDNSHHANKQRLHIIPQTPPRVATPH